MFQALRPVQRLSTPLGGSTKQNVCLCPSTNLDLDHIQPLLHKGRNLDENSFLNRLN